MRKLKKKENYSKLKVKEWVGGANSKVKKWKKRKFRLRQLKSGDGGQCLRNFSEEIFVFYLLWRCRKNASVLAIGRGPRLKVS